VAASLALHILGAIWLPSPRGISVAGAIAGSAQVPTPQETRAGSGLSMEILSLDPDASRPVVPIREGSTREAPNLDNDGATTGGTGLRDLPTWLLDESQRLTLQESVRNASDESQVQRIDTSFDRSSQENRRASRSPADATYLATDTGSLQTRVDTGRRDPAPGLRVPTNAGTHDPGTSPQDAFAQQQAGAGTRGEHTRDVERGRADTRGTTHAAAARQRTARPDVDHGPPATLASDFGRVQDNRNAELRAAQLVQAFVQSGSAGGQRADGPGGRDVGGSPGNGNNGAPGGRSAVRGSSGQAEAGGERYTRWYVEQRARITRALVFPRERQLNLDQGTTVLRLSIGRDGGLLEAPRMLRSSGFGDLDQAALAAVLESAPLSPLPPEIAPGLDRISLTVPVEFWNPTVH